LNDNGQLKGVDEEALDFYQNNYLPTLSYVQKQDNDGSYKVVSLITHNAEKSITIDDFNGERVCRYCGKRKPEVKFKKIAHLFPESLGNKCFFSNNECDNCNELFSKYENDLCAYLVPFLSTNEIFGKGKPKEVKEDGKARYNKTREYKSNDKTFRVQSTEKIITVTSEKDSKLVYNNEKKILSIPFDIGKHTPYNIYKCLLKMALAVLPKNEYDNYKIMQRLLKEDLEPIGIEQAIFTCYPGTNLYDLTVLGYKRTISVVNYPTYVFFIVFGNVSMQIGLFSDRDFSGFNKEMPIQFVAIPTPFDSIGTEFKTCQLVNLTSKVRRNSKIMMSFHAEQKD